MDLRKVDDAQIEALEPLMLSYVVRRLMLQYAPPFNVPGPMTPSPTTAITSARRTCPCSSPTS